MFNTMINKTVEVITNTMTEKDGLTWCPARILWVVGSIFYCVMGAWNVYKGQTFDFASFGTGFAAIQAAGSAAVRIKMETEQTVQTSHT